MDGLSKFKKTVIVKEVVAHIGIVFSFALLRWAAGIKIFMKGGDDYERKRIRESFKELNERMER